MVAVRTFGLFVVTALAEILGCYGLTITGMAIIMFGPRG